MIGPEFKTARFHLLSNLEGNIAWKDPAQAIAQKERLKAKREEIMNATATEDVSEPEENNENEEDEEQDEGPALTM